MNFNSIIKKTFTEFLDSLRFQKTEERENVVPYVSDKLTITFCWNPYTLEYDYFATLKKGNQSYANDLIEDFLKIPKETKSGLKTPEEKIEFLAMQQLEYFNLYKDSFLKGEKKFYAALKEYFEMRNHEYNEGFKEK